jgi:hypothetical protein
MMVSSFDGEYDFWISLCIVSGISRERSSEITHSSSCRISSGDFLRRRYFTSELTSEYLNVKNQEKSIFLRIIPRSYSSLEERARIMLTCATKAR